MTAESDEILDDLFHACAFAAFVQQAIDQKGPPDIEATRRRAYRLYEDALAERDRQRSANPTLTYRQDAPICSVNSTRDTMSQTPNPVQTIQIGDTVTYRFSVGELASEAQGKVIGLFNIKDGHTMADVIWDKLGPPKRLNVKSLAKV
jgi:hypothetical protein